MKLMNKNQTGFMVVIILLVVVIVAIIAGLTAFYVSQSKSEQSQESTAKTEVKKQETRKDFQADNTIKNHMALFSASVSNYLANNNGVMPESVEQVASEITIYNEEVLLHPITGKKYVISTDLNAPNVVRYAPGTTCTENDVEPATPRAYTFSTVLTDGSYYCIDS